MKLGLVGCGRMGRALVIGAIDAGAIEAENVWAYDIEPAAVENLAKEHKVNVAPNPQSLLTRCEVVLLCTKPTDVTGVLREIASSGTEANRGLLISVAAGVTIQTIERNVFNHVRVIRAMPNTPALVGKGAAAYSLGSSATAQDAAFAAKLLGSVGKVVEVPEKLLDAVTGLSGSGPGYVYLVIEALADGGVLCGLPREQALELATQTVLGAAAMIQETGLHPALLKDMVCSPGGTTIVGLQELEAGATRHAICRAVQAATERSVEIGSQKTTI